jgi:hypothetical protein
MSKPFILLGLNLDVNSSSKFNWYSKNFAIPLEPKKKIMNKFKDSITYPLLLSINYVLEVISQNKLFIENKIIGVALNAPNTQDRYITNYIENVLSQNKIRPHSTILIESSYPLAQCNINYNFKGPSLTLTDNLGGLHGFGWAHNILEDKQSDLMIVVDINIPSSIIHSDKDQFIGNITIAVLSNLKALEEHAIVPINDWGLHGKKISENGNLGKGLNDLLDWSINPLSEMTFLGLDEKNDSVFYTLKGDLNHG